MGACDDAIGIFQAAIDRVDPRPMVARCVSIERNEGSRELVIKVGLDTERIPIHSEGRIFAAGLGKAGASMAAGLEDAIGADLAGGLVAVKAGHIAPLQTIRLIEAGHPIPDERSIAAAREMLNLGKALGTPLTERDIVIVLISGGGSAIACAPAEGLSLTDKAETTRLLLASGATIEEINCVRKHLSAVKGGQLAAALSPATVLGLVLSDVVGDDLDAIASGPTVPDASTFTDALDVVIRHGIEPRLPASVLARLKTGKDGLIPETPKPGDPRLARTKTLLIGTNRLALEAAATEAERRGYSSLLLSSRVTGEAREVARFYLGIGEDIAASGFPLHRPACVIAGGETTVTIKGSGRGGRNQAMALAFLIAAGMAPKAAADIAFLSGGTDGNDGPTDAAGAVVDFETFRRAHAMGFDPRTFLDDNDSYGFFSAVGGLVKTGPTNTNVCDIQVLIVP